jgi:precorrin-4/cobalt-precorrin-4 C11-methyltransferase
MNQIYFVGAGPGSPDLITVKGSRLLSEADVIIYAGSLVNPQLLNGLTADIHNSAAMTLDEIVALMITAHGQNKKVIRLHTGDPAIFGAIKEQMVLLDKANIPYDVVPGVSSAAATAAALKAELTLPEVSQTVIITRQAGRTPVPKKEQLRLLASHQATMLIFLSVGMVDTVMEELTAGGYPESTPVAVVEKASWPEQKIVRGDIASIAALVHEAGIKKTAMIAVGRVFGQDELQAASKLYDKNFAHGCRP